MKYRVALLILMVFALAPAAGRSQGRTGGAYAQRETDDEVKVALYKKFFDNWDAHPDLAYEAAKEYLRRYSKNKDEYTDYLTKWTVAYEEDERARKLAAEREDRERRLLSSIYTEKKFADAYGLAKQVLTDNPNNLKALIALGYGGYLASETKNEGFNAEASRYAESAIRLIESGQAPDTWNPFKNKEDVLASLQYARGFYLLKTAPSESIGPLIKAAQIDSDRRTAPSTYYYLALAYEKGPYRKLSEDYTKRFANQPESAGGKAALEDLNKVIDRIIDAYARAVALAGSDAKFQANKAEWTKQLTGFYKFRHDNSDAGLNELIAGILSKPLPQP